MSIKPTPTEINEMIAAWKNGQSLRSIARQVNLGRQVVTRVIRKHIRETQLTGPPVPSANIPPTRSSRPSKLGPFLESLHPLLERYPKLTAQRAYEELGKLGYRGSYATVRIYMKECRPKPKAFTVRFETAPGAQAQMDWSSYTIDFLQEGRRRVELFSYLLGYSRRQYICFTQRQDFETTVRQHIAAFEYLGGLASVCLYDNMKVVVTRWDDGLPVYNDRFLSFATHYGFKPWACVSRRPQTKGKVERPFDYIEKNLLNGRTFISLDHLNETARCWLSEVADGRIHGTTGQSPLARFNEEKPHLVPLPAIRFDPAPVIYRTVESDGCVKYLENKYSVPWQLIGQSLPIRILEDALEIYNMSLDRVATHPLCSGRRQEQIDPTHRPPRDHQVQLSALRDHYSRWGQIGLEYFDGVQQKCRNGKHEATRILSLLHGYPIKDGQTAMQRGIQYRTYGTQSLERILAHCGTPKSHWEVLSQREQEALQCLTQWTRVEVRRSESYETFFHPQPDVHQHGQTNQPSREDFTVSGDAQSENDRRRSGCIPEEGEPDPGRRIRTPGPISGESGAGEPSERDRGSNRPCQLPDSGNDGILRLEP